VSRWTPCKRRDFIRRLRKLGFDGPYSGTRHQFMVYAQQRLAIPSNEEGVSHAPRIDLCGGAFYHVTARGSARQVIFLVVKEGSFPVSRVSSDNLDL